MAAMLACACEIVDNDVKDNVGDDPVYIGLDQVAEILSLVSLEQSHLEEVHDAVTSSSVNGYDEEYTMKRLFGNPGTGVGDPDSETKTYSGRPLRELIEEHVRKSALTKSSSVDPDMFLDVLSSSDLQIYWPFSEEWNGITMPVITFDPEDGSEKNIGYRLVLCDDGSRQVEEVIVDERMAEDVPVWVVNRNTDAGYTSLEMLRKDDPQWGEGGGTIIVRPESRSPETGGDKVFKTLVLKDFTMKRNYDSWFAGASEFFVKIGYVDDFTASTEAELRLFDPLVTDFMVVVKRSQLGVPKSLNVMLMSDWSSQMTACALMITEDDGGTQTEWTCKAKVFVASKSYGVEISLPVKTRDEIVWRGELATRWLEENENTLWAFGDVDLAFDLIEY